MSGKNLKEIRKREMKLYIFKFGILPNWLIFQLYF